ncbi:hypothetical protein HETIRDRAFT_17370, partial [Heterobasidion irregulare TC 32-1]
YGFFKILAKVRSLAYKLQIPAHWKIHSIFHVTMLTKYREIEAYRINFIKPLPEVLNNKKYYKIEAIL